MGINETLINAVTTLSRCNKITVMVGQSMDTKRPYGRMLYVANIISVFRTNFNAIKKTYGGMGVPVINQHAHDKFCWRSTGNCSGHGMYVCTWYENCEDECNKAGLEINYRESYNRSPESWRQNKD